MTPQDTKHKTRALWLTGVLHAFTHLYQVALMPLYLLIQKDFKFQNAEAATLLMTVLLVSCFGPSYAVGVLADKLNRKKLLTFGLFLNAIGFIALALAPTYGWALVSVIVAGLGGSFYHPAATALIARLFPRETGKALGLVGIGAGAGFFVGPLYAGWRAGALEPVLGPAAWRRPVLEMGVLGLIGAAVFALLAEEERVSQDEAAETNHPHKIFPSGALWFFFISYCLAFALRDFAGASMGSLGSLFLQKARGYDAQSTGLALSGIYLASIISNPLFGSLSDRGRKRWCTIALGTAACMMAIFPWVPARYTIPIYVIYGFFFLAGYPMTEAALMESVPDAVRGRVFGLFVMTGGVIGNLSHWLVGAKVKQLGPAATSVTAYYPLYGFLAILLLSSLSGLLCLNPIRKRESIKPGMASSDSVALMT
ncbi:MAG TPA: MFS transporter [Patescibacteria group bacterium]|nr:MFS transporter [Patescibacteria group bacterium]